MLDFASFDCLTAQFHVLQEKMRRKSSKSDCRNKTRQEWPKYAGVWASIIGTGLRVIIHFSNYSKIFSYFCMPNKFISANTGTENFNHVMSDPL